MGGIVAGVVGDLLIFIELILDGQTILSWHHKDKKCYAFALACTPVLGVLEVHGVLYANLCATSRGTF